MRYVTTRKEFDTTNYELNGIELTAKDFQEITLNYCHGATLYGKKMKGARPRWAFNFTNTLPQAYIRLGKVNTQEAYDFGKQLIEACYKANRVDFDMLRQAYKDVLRALQKHNCWFERGTKLPNPTTRTEVWFEDQAAKDIYALTRDGYQQETEDINDDALRFYCRAFNISAPEWFITFENYEVENMFAQCPTVSGTYKVSVNSDYAGNLDAEGGTGAFVPKTLRKDARPQKLATNDRAILVDSVNWFLSLPIDEQKAFLADTFEYTADGVLVEVSSEELAERELEVIREAMRLGQLKAFSI